MSYKITIFELNTYLILAVGLLKLILIGCLLVPQLPIARIV